MVIQKNAIKLNGRQLAARRLPVVENEPTMRRRLRSTGFVIISQALLMALAISWLIHMLIILVNGSAYFVENNPFILWAEIIGSVLIAMFAIFILFAQVKRLGERRRSDDMKESRQY